MTISEMIRGRSTLDQLDILMRADVEFNWGFGFDPPAGRYYGGQLTAEEVARLDPPKSLRGPATRQVKPELPNGHT